MRHQSVMHRTHQSDYPLVPRLAWILAAGAVIRFVMQRTKERSSLADQTVLITGGARGLGLVLAKHFVREGARIAICGRDQGELDRATEILRKEGSYVLPLLCDVTVRAEAEQTVQTVLRQLGRIDILINNAGLMIVGPQEAMDLRDYIDEMDTHFWGPLYIMLAAIPDMRRRHQGRIVNIASIGGKVSTPHLIPYSASKHALVGLSNGMGAELAKDGITVTTVSPGLMRTGAHPNVTYKGRNEREYAWFTILDTLPLVAADADSAASAIIRAMKRGDAELIITPQARILARAAVLFPNASRTVLRLFNAILPRPGGIGTRRASGIQSRSGLVPPALEALGERAARENNELPVDGTHS